MWLLAILSIFVLVFVNESLLWSYTINRHAEWIKRHPKDERRRINFKNLYKLSAFTAILSLFQLIFWIFLIVFGCHCALGAISYLGVFLFTTGNLFIIICLMRIVAKYSRLPKTYYPVFSNWLSEKWGCEHCI